MNKCGQIDLSRKVEHRARVQLLLESQERHDSQQPQDTQQQQQHQQHWSCCSPSVSNPHSFNTSQSFHLLLPLHSAGVGLFDLFNEQFDLSSSVGSSSCGQGHVAGRWSFEQTAWRVLGWTGQSGDRLRRGWRSGGSKHFWMSSMRSLIWKKEVTRNKKVKAPWQAIDRPDAPPHVLSAEGCLCQQHRPSYWLQQLSNICSLALTDEKGPVKMGRERTTRYVA